MESRQKQASNIKKIKYTKNYKHVKFVYELYT